MILYHITPERNLPSILKAGLIPAHERGLTCAPKHLRSKIVWLTDDPQFILNVQAGESWCEDHKPVILKVNCDGLEVRRLEYHVRKQPEPSHEYYVNSSIDMNRIQVVGTDHTSK